MKTLITSLAIWAVSLAPAASQALDGKTWDEIVAQAKTEGQVTWYVWYLQDDLRRAIKPFEDKFGVKVVIPEGSLDINTNKLLAERERETGDIDVFASDIVRIYELDRKSLFKPLTFLPKDDGRVSQLVGFETAPYAYAFWGNQTGIAYDSSVLSERDLPQTPDEFAAYWTANPGKFGFNYEKGGSGPSFYQNIIRVLTGIDLTDGAITDEKLDKLKDGFEFFNKHAQDYVVTTSSADGVIRLNDRELTMVPAWEDFLAGLKNKGEVREDVKFYVPQMGMFGGGNAVAIPANATHPAAAAVFVNWLTSVDAQTELSKIFGTVPMHSNVTQANTLAPKEQRVNSQPSAKQPFVTKMAEEFLDNVILNR